MTVSVLVPWRSGCEHREAAWRWVRGRYAASHPDWEIVEGVGDAGAFSRTRGILDAASKATGDVFVVADADVWCDSQLAVDRVGEHGWSLPHVLIHRLSEVSTALVLGGADWHGLPLSSDNPQDHRPYRGHLAGTLLVVRRDSFYEAPPDPRFVGWGQEDDAWASALRTLVGPPWRGHEDLVHLWHPPQQRRSRVVGNSEGLALARRYLRASFDAPTMRALIAEAR